MSIIGNKIFLKADTNTMALAASFGKSYSEGDRDGAHDTLCQFRGFSYIGQAELASLPAPVIADEGVVGHLNVDIITNTEDITSCLWETSSAQDKVKHLGLQHNSPPHPNGAGMCFH